MNHCNCENSACSHLPGRCCLVVGNKRAIHIGSICDTCAQRLPEKYILPSPS